MHLSGEHREGLCLCKRVATAQSHAGEQRILPQLSDQIANLAVISSGKIMRLWVLAAGAMMRAALRKDDESPAGAIHN